MYMLYYEEVGMEGRREKGGEGGREREKERALQLSNIINISIKMIMI